MNIRDAFVAKFNAAGSALVYSTYLGGSASDTGIRIAVDSSGNAYVAGHTYSSDFPTVNPLQPTCGTCSHGDETAFVAKLNAAGSALVYSTYLGGSNHDDLRGMAIDSFGNAYVTGLTLSTDFPVVEPIQATYTGNYDAFVAELNAAGSALIYSTYLGAGGSDSVYGLGIGTDSAGNTYVVGGTNATDLPTVNPLQPTNHGSYDAFVAKISPGAGVPKVILSPNSLAFTPLQVGLTSDPQTVLVRNSSQTTISISSIVASGDFAQTNNCGSSLAAGAVCNITVTFTPTSILRKPGAITITDNASNSPQKVTLSGEGMLPLVLYPPVLIFGNQAVNTTSPPQTLILTDTRPIFERIQITASGDFAQTNTCGSFLEGNSCTITVTYSPRILGMETGSLTVTDTAANSPQTTLSGRGVLPAQLSTPSVAFAAQTVGSTSPAWNVLMGNNLSTALPISIAFTGLNAGDFAETDNCAGNVAAKSRCMIAITFTPGAIGARTATMNVTDSASNSPQTLALTGTGQ